MDLDCTICWNLLLDNPAAAVDNGPPLAKRRKSDKVADSSICVTPCGHLFHKQCLSKWFESSTIATATLYGYQSGNCPTCRKFVLNSTLYPVYLEVDKIQAKASSQPPLILTPPQKSNVYLLKETLATSAGGGVGNKNMNLDSDKEKLEALSESLKILTKDLEDTKKMYAAEKERADMYEATVKSLMSEAQANRSFNIQSDIESDLDVESDFSDSESNDEEEGEEDRLVLLDSSDSDCVIVDD